MSQFLREKPERNASRKLSKTIQHDESDDEFIDDENVTYEDALFQNTGHKRKGYSKGLRTIENITDEKVNFYYT